jgi:PAS domain S-box-containing protein
MNRMLLPMIVAALIVAVAGFDFWTSADLIGSILFTLPLATGALQPSRRLLWGAAAAACLLTIAAEFWGFDRSDEVVSQSGLVNRALLVASLLTLTTFIHLWMNTSRKVAADAEHLAQILAGRRLTEEALRASEERYRMILDGIHDHAIFMIDPQGQIVSWNAGAERVKGYGSAEIIGRNFSCFFPAGDIERGKPQQILQMAAASGRYAEQSLRVRKDGSQFLASVTFTALRDASGKLFGFSEFSHDLSKATEAQAQYRGLLEAAPDAMVIVNEHGHIVLVNAETERLFGYPRDELIGQVVDMLVPDRSRGYIRHHRQKYTSHPRARSVGAGIELRGRCKDGSEFPLELMLSPLESPDGILVTATIRDITSRKSAELHLVKTIGELKRSNAELEHFAYVASHDLQEPLRMVASYTQLLAKRYVGRLDADADEFIAYAVDGSNRMQTMIQDLLTYSRAGATSEPPRRISSENALQEAIANLRVSIQESGAVVTHDSLPVITTDNTQLVLVFQNLIGNSIKYRSAAAPQVHVSARDSSGNWVFAVRDNGLGIDPKYFDRIFVLFQRLHGRAEFQGTGIGLSICKKILERLGGRIWVESQPDEGATFYFELPGVGSHS